MSENKKSKASGSSLVLFLLLMLLSVSLVFGQGSSGDSRFFERDRIAQQVGSKWIEVGSAQLERKMFESAERSLLCALDYEKYLTWEEKTRLSLLLENTRKALSERQEVLGHVKQADELFSQGQVVQAKAHLEKIKNSLYLTESEKRLVSENIAKLNAKIAELKSNADHIYDKSVEYYDAGQLAKSREGFISLAKGGFFSRSGVLTPEEYINRIDKVLGIAVPGLDEGQTEEAEAGIKIDHSDKTGQAAEETLKGDLLNIDVEPEPSALQTCGSSVCTGIEVMGQPDIDSMLGIAEPLASDDEEQYDDAINRKRKLLRGYAKASVREAILSVSNYTREGRYYKAEQAFDSAESSLNANRIEIGEDDFKIYRDQLDHIRVQIRQGRDNWVGQ